MTSRDEVDGPAVAVPCGRCGYDLRAAAADGVCPECGLSVAVALLADVAFGSAELRRMGAGARLLIGVEGATPLALAVYSSRSIVMMVPVVAVVVANAVAVWRLTTPGQVRPVRFRGRVGGLLRRGLRAGACAAVPAACVTGWWAARCAARFPWRISLDPERWVTAVTVAVVGSSCIGSIALLRGWAVRAGMRRFADQAAVVCVGLAVAVSTAVAFAVPSQSPSRSGLAWPLFALGVFEVPLMFFFGGWSMALLADFAGTMPRAAAGGAPEREGR